MAALAFFGTARLDAVRAVLEIIGSFCASRAGDELKAKDVCGLWVLLMSHKFKRCKLNSQGICYFFEPFEAFYDIFYAHHGRSMASKDDFGELVLPDSHFIAEGLQLGEGRRSCRCLCEMKTECQLRKLLQWLYTVNLRRLASPV